MNTTCQHEINEMNGKPKKHFEVYNEYDDPVFFNMQFCMERNTYEKIKEACDYRKATIIDIFEDFVDNLTPEKAEEILFSWDL